MSLNVNFKIETNQDCGKLKFTDTTCEYDPIHPAVCRDGYGVDTNINKWEVDTTKFNWITPSGTTFTKVDLGFVPGVAAKASFDITGGTDGVVIICVGGKEVGKAIFVTTIAAMVESLVVDINTRNPETGWKAIFAGTVITLVSTSTGTEFNGLSVQAYVTDSMTVTVTDIVTVGGDDGNDYFYITMLALYGGVSSSTNLAKFEPGIHTAVYIVYNSIGEEVSRKSLKVFIDCEIINGIRRLTELLMSGNCSCGNGTLAKKLLLLKSRYDALCSMFSKGEYDCINEEVEDLLEDVKSACLDC
jgi:hypothetical protein